MALALMLGLAPFIRNYRWTPELGLRFHVFDKDSGELIVSHTTEAAFAFHHVNAFERAALVADAVKVSLGIPHVSINGTGAVVAAHVGPGAVAVVVSPRGLHE